MSEPYLSTRSMSCMHLKKLKVFSSLCRPETHFRHAQGHQRAGALTGSINIFQGTIITVYEVEHQNTFNTKLGKQTMSSLSECPVYKRNQKLKLSKFFLLKKQSILLDGLTYFQLYMSRQAS